MKETGPLEIPPLEAMFVRFSEREDLREQTFSKGSGYLLYKLVDACVDASFPMLRKIGLRLERIEDDIFEGRSPQVVREISNVKQEIINFRKIARPQRPVLRDLEGTTQRFLAAREGEDLEIGDLVDLDHVLAEDRGSDCGTRCHLASIGEAAHRSPIRSTRFSSARRARAAAATTEIPAAATATAPRASAGAHGTESSFALLPVKKDTSTAGATR